MNKNWWQPFQRLVAWRPDLAKAAENLVLVGVLGIAALISYTHLREVWIHAGAPWAELGPLLVDGLFAAAWLRMRRRRREGQRVGFLAWLALLLALLATLAGNLAAAWIGGHREPIDLVVAGVPAATFALVWELVTGHGRSGARPARVSLPQRIRRWWAGTPSELPAAPNLAVADAGTTQAELAPAPDVPTETPFAWDPDGAITARAQELMPAGRPKLVKELDIKDWQAKDLVKLLASEPMSVNGKARNGPS